MSASAHCNIDQRDSLRLIADGIKKAHFKIISYPLVIILRNSVSVMESLIKSY